MQRVKKSFKLSSVTAPCDKKKARGFTLIEVMLAGTVMVLAISSCLLVLQQGMRAIDTARFSTLAGQILQSQMEKLRLLTWTQLIYLEGGTPNTGGPVNWPTFTPDLPSGSAHLNRFFVGGTTGVCAQSIVPAPSPFGATTRIITLTANWTGVDGRTHSLSYTTHYGKNGLSDFFYNSK
jgi:type II secretory pathway pseudopilin PulG